MSSSPSLVLHIALQSEWQAGQRDSYTGIIICAQFVEITSPPSGVDSTSPDVLWDSRPLRLSTVCHFLPGIRGLVISLPNVLARQWPTWLQRFFVHGCFYGPMVVPWSAHVHYCQKHYFLCFPFSFPHLTVGKLISATVIRFNIIPRLWMSFGGGLYCVAKGRQHLSNNLSKPYVYMVLVKALKKH